MLKGTRHTEESKKKNSDSQKEYLKSHSHSFKGKTHTKETKQKMSELAKKRWRENPKLTTGKNNGMYGRVGELNPMFGVRRFGKEGPMYGKVRSVESREKQGQTRRKFFQKHPECLLIGEKNPGWKGGITPQNIIIRTSNLYKEWRKAIFERDDYTCQTCGDNKGGNLNAHHIKSFTDYPELRFEVDNGKTLCEDCHTEIHPQLRNFVKVGV